MSKRWRVAWLVAMMAPFGAGAIEAPPALPLEGVWGATRHVGPAVRGPLEMVHDDTGWRASIAGIDVPVEVEGDHFGFTLPDALGSFSGRRESSHEIRGFWRQPERYASPVTLVASRDGTWRGEVVPLPDEFTAYLVVSRRPDGTLGAWLRNPDRNLGLWWGLERLETEGNHVRLVGRRRGQGDERVMAEGELRPDAKQLSIRIDDAIGTLDLVPVTGAAPGFYPRGKTPAPFVYRAPVADAGGWRVATLRSVGMRAEPLAELVRTLDAPPTDVHAPDIHGVLVARHGKLVFEQYFHGYDRATPHDTRSAAKVLATTLVGSVMRDHPQFRLDTPVYAALHVATDDDPRKRAMTVEHLLTMSSGYDCDDWDGSRPGSEDVIADEHPDVDVYDYTLRLPLEMAPGTQAVYCSINPNLLGKVVATVAGRPLLELFDERIAKPLQIDHYWLNLQRSGEPYLGGGVRLLPRDMMKFGQLMLDDGTWHGRRVLDADFARSSGAAHMELRDQNPPAWAHLRMRYGYLWWTVEYPYRGRTVHAYFASGNGGQEVVVVPELDLVVATYGGNYADRAGWLMVRELIPKYVLAAVDEAGASATPRGVASEH
jgi:CubicO group peptidase (beta-lactamase class C family)